MLSIRSRFGGRILFEGEYASVKELLAAAVKRGADLRGADLRGADLRRADLRGADLREADLRGARITDSIILQSEPLTVNGLRYDVMVINGTHLKIGCELHAVSEWESFSDERIAQMDSDALDFWRQWKEPLLLMASMAQVPDTRKEAKP